MQQAALIGAKNHFEMFTDSSLFPLFAGNFPPIRGVRFTSGVMPDFTTLRA